MNKPAMEKSENGEEETNTPMTLPILFAPDCRGAERTGQNQPQAGVSIQS